MKTTVEGRGGAGPAPHPAGPHGGSGYAFPTPAEIKYAPQGPDEIAVLTADPNPHPGWRDQVGPVGDTLNALDVMGHRRALWNRQFDLNEYHNRIDDPEFYGQCRNMFKRSLRGFPGAKSQYGLNYVEFSHGYTPDVVEAMGTARVMDLLKKQVLGELDKLAATHPVIVWRCYPEISTEKGWVRCYLRFHVMSERQYQHFAQSE